MKIVYILKKGFQHYPPCLTEVLTLADAKKPLCVYHGKNTPYIDALFERRGIEHHTLSSDKNPDNEKKSKLARGRLFLDYVLECRRVLRGLPKDASVWFGNAESAAPATAGLLRDRKTVFSVLELYENGEFLDRRLAALLPHASAVIARESHRAALMKVRYGLSEMPLVAPNKPYEGELPDTPPLPDDVGKTLAPLREKRLILYQGIVTPDRPLDAVAAALRSLGDRENVFLVLGRADDAEKDRLRGIWQETVFLGFLPAPLHLGVTRLASVGIANYDASSENNIFCAPNKIYEYARYGVPMLTSQNIGLTETVGAYGAGECVDFSDGDAVTDALSRLLSERYRYEVSARRMYKDTSPAPAILSAAKKTEM